MADDREYPEDTVPPASASAASEPVDYRALVEAAPDALLVCAPDRTVRYAAPPVAWIVGTSPEEVVGTTLAFNIDGDAAAARDFWERSLAARAEHGVVRSRIERADGTVDWLTYAMTFRYDASGAPQDVIVAVRYATTLWADSERNRVLLANTADVLFYIDADNRYTWASSSAREVLGWDPAELVGRTVTDFVEPDDAARIIEARLHPVAGIANVDEFRFRRKDGTYRWVSGRSREVTDERGVLVARVVALRDVEEQVHARERLAEAEAQYRLLVENAVDVVLHTSRGIVEWISPSVVDLLGYTSEEMIGEPTAHLWHPEDLDAAVAARDRTYAGLSARGRGRMRTKAGRYVWVEYALRPVRETDGSFGAIGSLHDVTGEVEAEYALAESEQRFRLVAENASDVVATGTMAGVFSWVSPSIFAISGWDPKEMVGRMVKDFFHPDDVPRALAAQAEVHRGSVEEVTLRLRCKDGSYRWIATRVQPMTSPDGTVIGRIANWRDVDAEIRARAEVQLAEQRFRLAIEAAPDGIAVLDLDGHFSEANPALYRLLHCDPEWLLEHRLDDLVADAVQLPPLHTHDERMAWLEDLNRRELRLLRPDGEELWVQLSTGLVRDMDDRPASFVVQFVDVTQARQRREDLRYQASHDSLTALLNREAMLTQLTAVLGHKPRTGRLLGVMFVDVDNLKPVNDTYGHAAGDALLVQTADRIQRHVRADDIVARVGGDEFVVVLPGITDLDAARAVADKLLVAFEDPMLISDHRLDVTVSVGLAVARAGTDPKDVLARADAALFRAKRSGRARIEVDPGGAGPSD